MTVPPRDSSATEYLIIGGGITNLAFAAALNSEDYLVVEALSDIGGYCQTVFQDGFVWDYSGHFFHFRHKEIEQLLVDRIGADRVRTVAKNSQIYFKGGWVDFPFQKNIHQLPREDFLECLVDLFETDERTKVSNFYEMLYAKFGRGISERFLVPYNEKLYATDLRTLDVNAMGRFFPHADRKEIVAGFRRSDNASYNATFTYPEGGAIEYVRAIAKDVNSDRISLNERLEAVDLRTKTARTNRRTIRFEHLVSAIPFVQLLQLTGLEYDPAIYTYNKVLVFNLGFDRKGPSGLHWVYYPEKDVSFYRIGFYDNIFDTQRMSLYVELGYKSDAVITPADVEEMRQRVLQDLRRVGIITDHELVSWHHIVLDPAYVHITERSISDVAAKKDVLATRGVYSVGRYGSWTYCSIEDNILEARALAARFNAIKTG
jgi:protoporphyrinogen oxidase